jgi:hypothetical protein
MNKPLQWPGRACGVLATFACLYAISRYSYPLFHAIAEMATVAVGFGLFAFTWNTRKLHENHFFLFLGSGFLFAAVIGLLHTIAYKGMGIFRGYDANLPTQLWIAMRYLEAGTFLGAFLFLRGKVNPRAFLAGFAAVTAVLASAIFGRVFPDCFVEGAGLTPFKVGSEFVIAIALLAANVLLYRHRSRFDRKVLHYLCAANFAGAAAEMGFTLYVDVYGLANLAGHFLRLVSVYLVYRAIIEIGLARPFDLLFRDLRASNDAQEKLIAELTDALEQVRTLKGMLPICASCKKIRDDQGYWEHVEVYIRDRSEAEFSHSICPECAHRLYPQYAGGDPADP